MYGKFKRLFEDDSFFFSVVIVLVAVSSFGLGRLSLGTQAQSHAASPVLLRQETELSRADSQSQGEGTETQAYVASKNGVRYHALWCPGAQQIKEANRIYFASTHDAEAAGYTPAQNCDGM